MSNELYPTYDMTLGGPNPLRGGTPESDAEMRELKKLVAQMLHDQVGGGTQQRVEQKKRERQEQPPSQTATQLTEGLVAPAVGLAATAIPVVGPFIAPLLGGLAGTAGGAIAGEVSGETGEMDRFIRSQGGDPGSARGQQLMQTILSGVSGGVTGGVADLKSQAFQDKLFGAIAGTGTGAGAEGGTGGFFSNLFGMSEEHLTDQAALWKEAQDAGASPTGFFGSEYTPGEALEEGLSISKAEDGTFSLAKYEKPAADMTAADWANRYLDEGHSSADAYLMSLLPEEAAAGVAAPEEKRGPQAPLVQDESGEWVRADTRSELDKKMDLLKERREALRGPAGQERKAQEERDLLGVGPSPIGGTIDVEPTAQPGYDLSDPDVAEIAEWAKIENLGFNLELYSPSGRGGMFMTPGSRPHNKEYHIPPVGEIDYPELPRAESAGGTPGPLVSDVAPYAISDLRDLYEHGRTERFMGNPEGAYFVDGSGQEWEKLPSDEGGYRWYPVEGTGAYSDYAHAEGGGIVRKYERQFGTSGEIEQALTPRPPSFYEQMQAVAGVHQPGSPFGEGMSTQSLSALGGAPVQSLRDYGDVQRQLEEVRRMVEEAKEQEKDRRLFTNFPTFEF